MHLLLCCLYLSLIYYRSEAASLTCDNTTDVCPGTSTELTCTCSVAGYQLAWNLPGSLTIKFHGNQCVGSNGSSGVFFAVVTNNTGGRKESMLIYNATESLVNDTIECVGKTHQDSVSVIIADTFAG